MARLKALRGGAPYRYLWRRHFPQLRASEVFITAEIIHAEPLSDLSDKSDLSERQDTTEIAAPEIAPSDTIAEMLTHEPCVPTTTGGYCFALKTNGLYDLGALLPNIGLEFPVGRHFSVGANWMYAWWKNHDRNRHWRIYSGDINARYYFEEGPAGRASLQGHHVGLYGQVLLFQVANGGKGYITGIPGENLWGKPWLGGGIEYGYSKRIGKRLNLDFTIGLGYIGGEYRVYRPVDDHYVWQSTSRRNWFGPTKAEISLVWLIGKMPGNRQSRFARQRKEGRQ